MSWGCRCGRLCGAGDRFCAACGGPRDQGVAAGDEVSKKAFLKKAELDDANALRGVRRVLREGERSYQQAERVFDAHSLAGYEKFEGWFGEWLRGGTERVDHYGMPLEDAYDDYDDFD